ncbi:bifunctional metallophosphatase/5'-nucleotidase [Natrononativus amylolyticus]|uniref:bifunctional metallophosphatase/5'-nucleotidase n=1 Tax=Natrononativus amylolyticus TaxID=2963434 RepID=UPI0020CF5530|nr:bifunctional metallophosphatase/5'-nucleotidase [Natrononativus amylolyticus]
MPLRLLQYSDVENACDDPPRIGRLAALLRTYSDDETLLVGTGDNTAPGVLPLVTEGRQVLEFYDAVEPDVATFGNHDFDFGPEAALEVVRESPHRWLSANVRRNGGVFGAEAGVEPWTILERADTRVGFTGVTTARTGSLNPMATGLEFREPIPAARDAVDALRAAGVDCVVVCSHLGSRDDELARAVDADVILGGHVASSRIERIDGTLVTRPGDGGHAVVEVTIDAEPTATLRSATEVAPAPDVVSAFERLVETTGLDDVVARVDEPLERTEETLFGGESPVGNFVADAYRWQTGADVALQNSGGIRSGSPLEGEVTVADCISLVPFDEPLTVAELDGETLEAVVSDAAGLDLSFAEDDWWHAHVSGMALEWNPADHAVDLRRVGGEPFDPDGTYTLATSDYLFHTTDEFPALGPDHRREQTAASQYEVLAAYAREFGIEPGVDGRVRRVD